MTDGTDIQTGLIHTEVPDAETVVARVTVHASRPHVFQAFTDPAVLVQWFWPQRFGTRFDCDLAARSESTPTDCPTARTWG